jgi:hypothetical protein
MDADPLLVLNGIDVGTGGYLAPKLALADVAAELRGDPTPPAGIRELRRRRHNDEESFGVVYGRNPQDLASVGWGVVIPPDFDPELLKALDPLLRLREEQAGDVFRHLEIRPGEDKEEFLIRHGMAFGVVDPRRVPYYLLLLGSPDQVPFEVQYQLGVSYAVGRLDLGDADSYAAYASTVVAAERKLDAPNAGPPTPSVRRLHLFATRHPGDVPTALSTSRLAEPLHAELRGAARAWRVGTDFGEDATRARLEHLLTEPDAPDLLFTAGHGLGGKAAGRDLAGALLCQDWPGPLTARGPVTEDQYLAASHLAADTPITPKVVFSFACFGAGTPRVSDYPGRPDGDEELAASGFTARLPQRLLGSRAGGALAFVGHVDRAWSCSFVWKGLTAQVTPFQSTLLALMDGARLGSAMESLSSRYAEIATELAFRLDEYRRRRKLIDDADLVGLWTATHDARAYVVLGDPAIRAARPGCADLVAG